MKKLLALLLVLSTLLLSSCSAFGGIYHLANDYFHLILNRNEKETTDGELDYSFDDSLITEIDERFEKMDEMLEENSRFRASSFILYFSNQLNDINYISDKSTIAYVHFCMDTNDAVAKGAYEKLNKLHMDKLGRLIRMYRPVYESKMKNAFFKGWTEEEIQDSLKQCDMMSEDFLQLKNINDSLIIEYQSLDQNASNFPQKSAKIYKQIVENNQKIAKKSGYASYPEYAYKEIYGRDYSPKDVQHFATYVSQYLVPLANEINNEFGLLSVLDKRSINNIIHRTTSKKMTSTKELDASLEKYYNSMGTSMTSAYDSFKKNYYMGKSNSYEAAFTTYLLHYKRPIAYFGQSYTNLSTFVHEQGHYAAFYLSNGSIQSIDLCETHSQGNEWLYLSYIHGGCTGKDAKFEDLIYKNYFYQQLVTLILATVCDSFERAVYADDTLTEKDYDSLFVKCAKELGCEEFLTNSISMPIYLYWHYAIISNSMYYISYATSLIPSIELFVNSKTTSFEAARDQYLHITENVKYNAPFNGTLISAGLSNVFEEDVYKKIASYFQKNKK